jgi:hypothetical protein
MGVMPVEVTSESLLAEADKLYRQASGQYRDGIICVGRLLHEFVIAYLIEGDSLPNHRRHKAKITRKTGVRLAAERLGVKPDRVHHLILIAMSADLLSDGGNVGNLAAETIYRFRVFICRVGFGDAKGLSSTVREISRCETWEVKPEFHDVAKKMFRRAVVEGWGQIKATDEIKKVFGSRPNPRRRSNNYRAVKVADTDRADDIDEEDHNFPTMEGVLGSLAKASPGDVSNECLKIVLASEEPWQVAQRLIAELQRIPREKPCSLLFQTATDEG